MDMGNDIFTGSARGVWMNPDAMELTLMLSFAHSHAKYFASWFMALKTMELMTSQINLSMIE